MEEARNAAFWPLDVTLASLLKEGLQSVVERLETDSGGPFRARTSAKLRAGRQVRAI